MKINLSQLVTKTFFLCSKILNKLMWFNNLSYSNLTKFSSCYPNANAILVIVCLAAMFANFNMSFLSENKKKNFFY